MEPAIESAIEHWRVHGWARLGRVASEEQLVALRARADDLMLGRVVHEGLFFQHDSPNGRYEDLQFGEGWVGPERLVPEDREARSSTRSSEAGWRTRLFEEVVRAVARATPWPSTARTLFAQGERAAAPISRGTRTEAASGASTASPELQLWTAPDDVPIESGCVEVVDASHRAGLASRARRHASRPTPSPREQRQHARAAAALALAGEVLLIHNYLWHRSGQQRVRPHAPRVHGRAGDARSHPLHPQAPGAPAPFVRVFQRS